MLRMPRSHCRNDSAWAGPAPPAPPSSSPRVPSALPVASAGFTHCPEASVATPFQWQPVGVHSIQLSHFQEGMTFCSLPVWTESSQAEATAGIPLAENPTALGAKRMHSRRLSLSSGSTSFISSCSFASFLGNCYDHSGTFSRDVNDTP